MRSPSTLFLRLLLAVLLFLLLVGAGLLYLIGVEMAWVYPEAAHLRIPIYLACLVGLIPVTMGVVVAYRFLRFVDRGEAFSEETVRLLHRLRWLLIVTGAYMMVGIVVVSGVVGTMNPGVIIMWFGLEVIVVFLIALVSLFKELFSKAFELRQDVDLTV